MKHEIFNCPQYVVCDYCGYKEPTDYAPTESMNCPKCGASMGKPKMKMNLAFRKLQVSLKANETLDLHKLCMSPQSIEVLSKYYVERGDKKE